MGIKSKKPGENDAKRCETSLRTHSHEGFLTSGQLSRRPGPWHFRWVEDNAGRANGQHDQDLISFSVPISIDLQYLKT